MTFEKEKFNLARESAQKVVQIHRSLIDFIRPGKTLEEIDIYIAKQLEKLDSSSCFLNYVPYKGHAPFPSHACLSVNECIVHGTHDYLQRPLQIGDLIKVDIGVNYKGWLGDAAWTYSIGPASKEIRHMMNVGKKAIQIGLTHLRNGQDVNSWAEAVYNFVDKESGLFISRSLTGHGYNIKDKGKRILHGAPIIPNFPHPAYSSNLKTGDMVAVEPMISLGSSFVKKMSDNKWPLFTSDDSMSVHYEHDVLITDNDPEILTQGLDDLQDELPV